MLLVLEKIPSPPCTSVSHNGALKELFGSRLTRLKRWTRTLLYVGLKIQMFLNRPDQKAPGLILWNQQHWSYLHYVLIPSEPEHFSLDKFIPEALPLLKANPAGRLVHLYKLLCGLTFDRSSSSNALPLRVCLRHETGKTRKERCEGSFVIDAPVERCVRATLSAQVRAMDGCDCDLPQKQTAISRSLRRTALRRHFIAPK